MPSTPITGPRIRYSSSASPGLSALSAHVPALAAVSLSQSSFVTRFRGEETKKRRPDNPVSVRRTEKPGENEEKEKEKEKHGLSFTTAAAARLQLLLLLRAGRGLPPAKEAADERRTRNRHRRRRRILLAVDRHARLARAPLALGHTRKRLRDVAAASTPGLLRWGGGTRVSDAGRERARTTGRGATYSRYRRWRRNTWRMLG